MSYRDDHAAAIARIDALEHELSIANENEKTLESKVSRLQREIRRLEGTEDATIAFTPIHEPKLPAWIGVANKTLGFIVFTSIALIVILGVTSPG